MLNAIMASSSRVKISSHDGWTTVRGRLFMFCTGGWFIVTNSWPSTSTTEHCLFHALFASFSQWYSFIPSRDKFNMHFKLCVLQNENSGSKSKPFHLLVPRISCLVSTLTFHTENCDHLNTFYYLFGMLSHLEEHGNTVNMLEPLQPANQATLSYFV